MKTKIHYLLLILIAGFIAANVPLFADEPPDEDEDVDLYCVRPPILKSSHGSFSATCNSATLTVDVDYYRGDVVIEILNPAGSLVLSSTLYVDGFASKTLDISQLQAGDYVLRIVAGDVIYEGSFHVPD